MLSDRRQRVLGALIEEYVLRALPVGSRTLVEQYKLGVSPATVRNELSVLEEAGYISQPHTSAGRIPTDFGYRTFVDELLESGLATGGESEQEAQAVRNLRESAKELDELFDKTTEALARLTDCLSIVIPPSTLSLSIKQISFLSMSTRTVLIVVVTEDGQVLNRQVDFHDDVDCDDLARAQNTVNRLLAGKSMKVIRDDVDDATLKSLDDPLVKMLIAEVCSCLGEGDAVHAHRVGLSTLMMQPEFEHSQALIPVLQMLEDDTVLLEFLQDVESGDDTVVRIGKENKAESLSGVSVVASQYGRGDSAGIVAVIGPTRMKYAQVIRAVRVARDALQGE